MKSVVWHFDTSSVFPLIILMNLWILCGQCFLPKCYKNLVVDFIDDLCHAVIFLEFIGVQKYMLLL